MIADPAYVASLRANAGPGVRFFGALTHAQVWDILDQIDAVAVPSLWYETFSLIAHEAFAAGRPVIASGLGRWPRWSATVWKGYRRRPATWMHGRRVAPHERFARSARSAARRDPTAAHAG